MRRSIIALTILPVRAVRTSQVDQPDQIDLAIGGKRSGIIDMRSVVGGIKFV